MINAEEPKVLKVATVSVAKSIFVDIVGVIIINFINLD